MTNKKCLNKKEIMNLFPVMTSIWVYTFVEIKVKIKVDKSEQFPFPPVLDPVNKRLGTDPVEKKDLASESRVLAKVKENARLPIALTEPVFSGLSKTSIEKVEKTKKKKKP